MIGTGQWTKQLGQCHRTLHRTRSEWQEPPSKVQYSYSRKVTWDGGWVTCESRQVSQGGMSRARQCREHKASGAGQCTGENGGGQGQYADGTKQLSGSGQLTGQWVSSTSHQQQYSTLLLLLLAKSLNFCLHSFLKQIRKCGMCKGWRNDVTSLLHSYSTTAQTQTSQADMWKIKENFCKPQEGLTNAVVF